MSLNNSKKTVYVGLSGGVDSSVAASIVKNQGYNVIGVYMKNWSKSLPGFECPWKDDYQDAKRVAVQLGIDFKVFDFENEYKQKVVDVMLEDFKLGLTPNPDIVCNQEIKFKLFLNVALEQGADYIATGHYANIKNGRLYKAFDSNKDQTYFLYRVTSNALLHTMFPLGELLKSQVRSIANNLNLVTAAKKESMGICFVGKVGIKDFLLQYIEPKEGRIIDQFGKVIGTHDGAIFYTIGQRHGLNIGGGMPYYVVNKDIEKNEVYVSSCLDDKRLWHNKINLNSLHWINNKPDYKKSYQIRIRHRATLMGCRFINSYNTVELDQDVKALTPGQSAVIYDDNLVLGGGIII